LACSALPWYEGGGIDRAGRALEVLLKLLLILLLKAVKSSKQYRILPRFLDVFSALLFQGACVRQQLVEGILILDFLVEGLLRIPGLGCLLFKASLIVLGMQGHLTSLLDLIILHIYLSLQLLEKDITL